MPEGHARLEGRIEIVDRDRQNAVIVPREYDLDPRIDYILTGLRRSGKSTLLYHLARRLIADGVKWEQIIYINFEDERLAGFSTADFNDIIAVQSGMSSLQGHFFFDEIQNVPGWEKFARRMADAKEHVCITGSNSSLLSGEMASVLGGRYLTKKIRPYSFSEYLTARQIPHSDREMGATKARGRIISAFDDYMREGGLPEALIYPNKREYISSVFQKVLLGDVITRHGIRNDYAMKMLIKKIAETVKDQMSYSKFHGVLNGIGIKISKDSVIDYIQHAQEAYLLIPVRNYFAKFTERENASKYYLSDNGILNLFLTKKEGTLLENLTAIELERKYGEGVFYLRSDKTGIDVDFYLPETGTAIQVCWDLNDLSNEREINNLVRLKKKMPETGDALIVTRASASKTFSVEGVEIRIVPAESFFLSK